jgi:NADH-quinone oxidoreductase subunit D
VTSTTFEYAPHADQDDPLHGELMELNMGPQHPATHGVMRVLLRADGEVCTGG